VSLVPRRRYVEATQLLYGSRSLAFAAGPGLAGTLTQAISAPAALLVDAGSYVVSALSLRGVRAEEPPPADDAGGIRAGLRFIRDDRCTRDLLGATATVNLFNLAFLALFVLYLTRSLHVTPAALGAILAAAAVGGLVGAVVAGPVSARIGVGPACALGCALFPAPLLLVPLAGGSTAAVAGVLVVVELLSGAGVVLLDVSVGALRAALVPDEVRSRVSGAYQCVNFGVRPLGSLLGGVLGATIGLRPTLALTAAGATCSVAWLLRSPVLALRRLDGDAG
jgi:predicted MFS family arabinose efflux permease